MKLYYPIVYSLRPNNCQSDCENLFTKISLWQIGGGVGDGNENDGGHRSQGGSFVLTLNALLELFF